MGTTYIRRNSEDTEQETVIRWARLSSGKYPELKLLHHIPNGGSRNRKEAVKLKRMGVVAGVPDLHLPVARAGYYGMYIEMKYADGRIADTQKEFMKAAAKQNYYCLVCYTAESAIAALDRYLHDLTAHPNLTILKANGKTGTVK